VTKVPNQISVFRVLEENLAATKARQCVLAPSRTDLRFENRCSIRSSYRTIKSFQ
jgi:hypothetical protein